MAVSAEAAFTANEYRDDPSKLDLVRIRAPSGALAPLRNLVTPRIGSGPVEIERDGRTRAITLSGNLDGKAAATADEGVVGFGREFGTLRAGCRCSTRCSNRA